MSPNVLTVPVGLSNDYKLSVTKADANGSPIPGTERDLTGWFHNLITDTGMENFGNALSASGVHWGRGCRVGTGSAAPQFTDTNLQSIVATTVSKISNAVTRNLAATPAYIERTIVYRFAAGAAAGNLAEVGLVGSTSDGSSTGGALHNATPVSTRALILDGSGNPTTVTVLSDEILDVTCRQRLYIPGDVTGTITPDGGVSGPIDYVIRPCEVDQNIAVNGGGWGGNSSDTGWDFTGRYSSGFGECAVFLGATSGIGGINDTPTGTKASGGSAALATLAYVPGSRYRDVKNSYDLSEANNAAGIGASMISFGSCSFQIGFTPRVMKTADMLFDITLRLSWARYTP